MRGRRRAQLRSRGDDRLGDIRDRCETCTAQYAEPAVHQDKKPATKSRAFYLNGDADVDQRMARPVVGVGGAVSAVRVVRGVRTFS